MEHLERILDWVHMYDDSFVLAQLENFYYDSPPSAAVFVAGCGGANVTQPDDQYNYYSSISTQAPAAPAPGLIRHQHYPSDHTSTPSGAPISSNIHMKLLKGSTTTAAAATATNDCDDVHPKPKQTRKRRAVSGMAGSSSSSITSPGTAANTNMTINTTEHNFKELVQRYTGCPVPQLSIPPKHHPLMIHFGDQPDYYAAADRQSLNAVVAKYGNYSAASAPDGILCYGCKCNAATTNTWAPIKK